MLSTITELNLAGKTDIKHIIMTIKCIITGMRNAVKEFWVLWEGLTGRPQSWGSQGRFFWGRWSWNRMEAFTYDCVAGMQFLLGFRMCLSPSYCALVATWVGYKAVSLVSAFLGSVIQWAMRETMRLCPDQELEGTLKLSFNDESCSLWILIPWVSWVSG